MAGRFDIHKLIPDQPSAIHRRIGSRKSCSQAV